MAEAAGRGLRAWLAALALLAAAPALASAAGPLDLVGASLTQAGTRLRFTVRTRGPWAAQALTSRPGRSLCLVVSQAGRRGFVCVTAAGRRARLTYTPAGGASHALRATVDRPNLRTLVAGFA